MARLTLIRRTAPMKDGRYRVYVRLSHKGEVVKRSTDFFCTEKDTDEGGVVTSPKLIVKIYSAFFQEWEERLEHLIETTDTGTMSAEDLFDYVTQTSSKAPDIRKVDFMKFGWEYFNKCVKEGRKNSALNFRCVLLALEDFTGKKSLTISELTTTLIDDFVKYLSKPHSTTRLNQGSQVTTKRNGLKPKSINNYIRDFKTMISALKMKYSDPLTGEDFIRTNPFRFWKQLVVPNADGYRAVSKEIVRQICHTPDDGLTEREKLGRDLFIISFCLLGINATDLYDLTFNNYDDGRIWYNRNKTKGRRADGAYISVLIPPQIKDTLKRYAGTHRLFNFSDNYCDVDSLSKAVNKGLKSLCEKIGVPKVTYYSARHSWATIARNDCKISREDVDMALDHITSDLKMADKYVAKDFSINDENNKRVMELVFGQDA